MQSVKINNGLRFWKNSRITIEFLRYLFAGGIAYVVDIGTLVILVEFFHIHLLVSVAIAFILGGTVNYALSITLVFKNRSVNTRSIEITTFFLIGMVGLGFNELFIWFLTEQMHQHYLVGKIVSTVLVVSWNFLAKKFVLFR